jgi:hypothetical protein
LGENWSMYNWSIEGGMQLFKRRNYDFLKYDFSCLMEKMTMCGHVTSNKIEIDFCF